VVASDCRIAEEEEEERHEEAGSASRRETETDAIRKRTERIEESSLSFSFSRAAKETREAVKEASCSEAR